MGDGLHNPARVEHVVNGDAVLHDGLGIVASVVAVSNFDMSQILPGNAVLHHVPRKGEGKALYRADEAVGTLHNVWATNESRGLGPSASDAHLGVAIHGAEYGDCFAHACLDSTDGYAY